MSTPHIDARALDSSLRRLAETGDETNLAALLQTVIDACVQLFGVSGAGLMLADEQAELRYVIAGTGPSEVLERTQIETGEGPCIDTYVHGEIVVTNDIAADERYPTAGPLVAPHGIGAVLGVPVHLSGVPIGSLDVYVDHPYDFDQSDIDALSRYRRVVEAMLSAAVSAAHAGQLADRLHYALDYRVPIERAIGYLMARDGVGSVEAFNQLRGAARASRRKIGDVADALLSTGYLPHETGDRGGNGK